MLAVVLVCGFLSSRATAQEVNPRFRDFRSKAPSPSQLMQALRQQSGLNVPASKMEALQNLLGETIKDLSPEKQKGLLDVGKKLLERQEREGKSVKLPKDLTNFVDPEMREQLREQFSDEDLSEFRDLLQRFNQPSNETRNGESNSGLSEGLRDALERFGGDALDQPPVRRPQGNNNVNPPQQGNRNKLNDRDRPKLGGGNSSNTKRNSDRENTRQRDRDLSSNEDRPSWDSDRERKSSRNKSRRPDQVDEPDPSRFDLPEPKESPGNRIDRLVMDAISKSAEREAGGGSESGFASSLRSILDGAAGTIQDRLAGRRFQRGRSSSDASSGGPRMLGNFRMPRIGGGGGSGPTMLPDVQQVSWLMLGILGLIVLAVAGWLLLKMTPKDQVRANDPDSFRRSFRLAEVRSSSELVKSVDGYLLAHFGMPSSWWHSRRAEVALNSRHPNLGESICELVDAYEFARYSEVGDSLSETRVQRCAGILANLVSRPADNAEVNDNSAPVSPSMGNA